MKCPACGLVNLPEARFCGHCGARLVQDCSICGLANPLEYRFCHRCGAPLTRLPEARALREPIPHETLTPPPPTVTPGVSAPDDALLPAETPDTLPAPTALQAIRESRLEGERRIATIILADIKSSTDLMERLGTEAWVAMMNHVFQILETEIYRFGGKVDQFRGDGLVAFFGTATAHEDDPERAVLAALAMQEALKPYAAELSATDDIDLSMRVGVNTGEVIVASVGDRRRYSEDTAMGEAIALAARMETAAEPGAVLVSENTYRVAADHFEWATLGEIMVKGISHPIAVYRPLRPIQAQHETYNLAQPLIGREEEFQTLKAGIESLSAGRGGIITLAGERGMGKSLLLREIYRYFVRQQALLTEACDRECALEKPWRELATIPAEDRMLRGRARSYDQSKPYALWIDLLRSWLDIPQNEAKEITCERLRQRAEVLWDDHLSEYYPYLAALLSLPVEAHYAEQINRLDAETRRQQLFLAIREWVEALARQGALVISFSDLHWVDTTSLDLLKYCLPVCDYAPVLWLLVFRPEPEALVWKFRYYLETEYPHRLTALTMRPLTAAQSHDFLTLLIGTEVLPPEVEALVIDKADGNPYYIQELIHALIAQGCLVKSEPDGAMHWSATQPVTELDLPDSLQTLLLARIDRLPTAEHLVLQMAAVIGPVFWSNVLEVLTGPDLALHPCLTTLLRTQLIRERGRDTDLGVEYIFKSPLIRDAAYDSLLSPQRTAYHLQIAEYFEQHFGEEAQRQYYGTLAHHYHHAGKPEKELAYTLKQAELAQKVYANAEAGEHYTRALALLDVLEAQSADARQRQTLRAQRFDALYGRRRIFNLMGRFAAMREDALALLPLARQLRDDPARLIDALLAQPGVSLEHGYAEVTTALPLTEEALTLARQIGDRPREIHALIARTNQSLVRGDPAWQEHADHALTLARQIGDQRAEARLLIGLGQLYAGIDQPERSMEYVEAAAALSLSQALDHIPLQISLLGALGIEVQRGSDYYRLLTEYHQEQLHLSREIGHRPLESKMLLACGITQGLYLGDYQGGLDLMEESRRVFEDDPNKIEALLYIIQIQSDLEMYDEAQANLDRITHIGGGESDLDAVNQYLTEIVFDLALGDVAHLRAALTLCDKLSAIAAANPVISQQYVMAATTKAVVAHLELAKLAQDWAEREADYLAALKASQTAYDLYQTFGYAQLVECLSEEVLFRRSQALAANGYEDDAIKYLRRAYDEMIRKYALIPPDTPFRRTYLDNISLHQDIRIAYAARVGSILTESAPVEVVAKVG